MSFMFVLNFLEHNHQTKLCVFCDSALHVMFSRVSGQHFLGIGAILSMAVL